MHTYSTGFPIKNECCKFSGQNSNRNTYFHSQKSNFLWAPCTTTHRLSCHFLGPFPGQLAFHGLTLEWIVVFTIWKNKLCQSYIVAKVTTSTKQRPQNRHRLLHRGAGGAHPQMVRWSPSNILQPATSQVTLAGNKNYSSPIVLGTIWLTLGLHL